MAYNQGNTISNASTSSTFTLLGGKYGVVVGASWNSSGTVTLNILAPDGTTWVAVGTSTTLTANGYAVVDLPPGQYQWAIATATGVYAAIERIPSKG